MEYLLTLLALTIGLAQSKTCTHIIQGINYDRKTILEIEGLPTNLAYNSKTGDLYFTLIDVYSLMNDEMETKMDQYVFKNGFAKKIDDINGQTTAINKQGKVLFGTYKGLYVYDENLEKCTLLGLQDDIVQLANPLYSDNLYAVIYPENEVYIINDDGTNKTKVEDIQCANFLTVDQFHNIYYGCESNYVSVLLKGFKEPIQYVGLKSGAGRALTYTKMGSAVLAATDGLYILNPDNVIPKKIAELDFVPSGIAVDGGDYYISANGKIFKYESYGCTI